MRTAAPNIARTIEAGILLIGLGALLLLVSLFLVWYQPAAEAWDVFEAWDLVLALLAIGALVAVAGRLGFGPSRPSSWLLVPSAAALVIVLYALVEPPPAVAGLPDADPGTGLWLALAGTVLMAAGALLSVARISVAISTTHTGAGNPSAAPHDVATPAAGDPRRGDRVVHAGPVQDAPPPGVAPSTGGTPPTEPTRRL